MPKGILEFDLENLNDVTSMKRCLKSEDLLMVITDILEVLGTRRHHPEWFSSCDFDTVEEIFNRVKDIIEESAIDIEELSRAYHD